VTLEKKIMHLQNELNSAKLLAKSDQKFRTMYQQNRSVTEIKRELRKCERIMWRNPLRRWWHRLFWRPCLMCNHTGGMGRYHVNSLRLSWHIRWRFSEQQVFAIYANRAYFGWYAREQTTHKHNNRRRLTLWVATFQEMACVERSHV
jgi:hypothetical protein